jgi:NhaA family Na+:H+ antiporter
MSDAPILDRARHALTDFLRLESAGGILLIGAALLALICANSPLEEFYDGFRDLPVAVQVGRLEIAKPLLLWINDGLMAIFFLLVALEIKREALSGQLSSRDQLALPLLCAAAGVAVPAAIFFFVNRDNPTALQGWAIPAATDIAFALGILSLLGSRVPVGMKLLLSTIAVIDDLAAILIIALFYSGGLSMTALAWAAAAVGMMVLLNRRHVTALTPYLLLGVFVWICVLKSGMHATLAGVITGLLIPHYNRKDAIDDAVQYSPLESLEHALHPWVAYLILPLFAFANAGLALGGFEVSDVLAPVPLGIALGLVLGKPLGVVAMAALAHATGKVRYPDGMDLRSMVGLGLLCGIGFTMSLFIASLAYSNDGDLFQMAVLGVLCASLAAAVAGYVWLRYTLPAAPAERME